MAFSGDKLQMGVPCIPFPELGFMRLGDGWQEMKGEALLLGDSSIDTRILRQYRLSWAPWVMLDFWYRGMPVSVTSGQHFLDVLRQAKCLTHDELLPLAEVLGVIWDQSKQSGNVVKSAEVQEVSGKRVLVINWHNATSKRAYLSMLFEVRGDGRMIREMHFSAPQTCFHEHLSHVQQCWLSIQWNQLVPPPLSFTA